MRSFYIVFSDVFDNSCNVMIYFYRYIKYRRNQSTYFRLYKSKLRIPKSSFILCVEHPCIFDGPGSHHNSCHQVTHIVLYQVTMILLRITMLGMYWTFYLFF